MGKRNWKVVIALALVACGPPPAPEEVRAVAVNPDGRELVRLTAHEVYVRVYPSSPDVVPDLRIRDAFVIIDGARVPVDVDSVNGGYDSTTLAHFLILRKREWASISAATMKHGLIFSVDVWGTAHGVPSPAERHTYCLAE